MKKTRQSPTKDFKPEPLPTSQEVEKTIHAIQETPGNRAGSVGRPIKAAAADRVKFNTMIKADYIKELKKAAIDQNLSTADLLELIIAEYLKR